MTSLLDRWQLPLYLAALVAGGLVGLTVPEAAVPAGVALTPVLALLLYATFLGVPFAQLPAALRDVRFLATILAVNFAVVPVVVWGLTRFVAHDEALLVGVLLVLLTPCVDYVLVFTGLAGGARTRLLATTPLLMLVQIVLLPVQLRLLAGPEVVAAVDIRPFAEAFLTLIVLPLAAAAMTQLLARGDAHAITPGARPHGTRADSQHGSVQSGGVRRVTTRWVSLVEGAMVPLMMLTLALAVASQIDAVRGMLGSLLVVVPLFVVFAALLLPVGIVAGRLAGLDAPGIRAVAFSGVTRNSLVVLPLALALPSRLDLAPLVVVTQTLVELLVMVVMVRLVPRLVRA